MMNRRDFVLASASLATTLMLPQRASAATETAFDRGYDDILAKLQATFFANGYNQLSADPFVTENADHNAGLRSMIDYRSFAPGTHIVQTCARIDDISETHRSDILPVFTQFGGLLPNNHAEDAHLALAMDVLSNSIGLDPSRLAIVSVPEVEALRPHIEAQGLDFESQVWIRDPSEAKSARDSSGYIFPIVGSDMFVVSAGLYYRLDDATDDSLSAYPPSAKWTEIGELIIAGNDPLGLVFGVERLVLAATGEYPTWEEQLPKLFDFAGASGSVPTGLADLYKQ